MTSNNGTNNVKQNLTGLTYCADHGNYFKTKCYQCSSKYARVLIFKSAYCESCGALISFTDLIVCRDETEMIERAEREHRDARIESNGNVPCIKPALLIFSDNALISDTALRQVEAANAKQQ